MPLFLFPSLFHNLLIHACLSVHVDLCVCSSVCVCVCVFVCSSVCLFSLFVCVCLFFSVFVCSSVCLFSLCVCVCSSLCVSIPLCVCSPVCLYGECTTWRTNPGSYSPSAHQHYPMLYQCYFTKTQINAFIPIYSAVNLSVHFKFGIN